MASSISDIVEGNGGRLTSRGWEFTRIFTVKDILGEGYAMIKNAVETIGVPARGDPHPSVPDAFVVELNPVSIPTAANQVRITVLYRENEAGQVSYNLSGTPAFIETTNYFNRTTGLYAEADLEYTFPAAYPNPDYAGLTANVLHKMTVLEPRPTIRITRFETTTIAADAIPGQPIHAKDIIARQVNYISHAADSAWNLLPLASGHGWLCVDIIANKIPDQVTWQVTYIFQFDRNGWDELAQFTDFNRGRIPFDLGSNPSAPDSEKTFTKYRLADFSKLELSWG